MHDTFHTGCQTVDLLFLLCRQTVFVAVLFCSYIFDYDLFHRFIMNMAVGQLLHISIYPVKVVELLRNQWIFSNMACKTYATIETFGHYSAVTFLLVGKWKFSRSYIYSGASVFVINWFLGVGRKPKQYFPGTRATKLLNWNNSDTNRDGTVASTSVSDDRRR